MSRCLTINILLSGFRYAMVFSHFLDFSLAKKSVSKRVGVCASARPPPLPRRAFLARAICRAGLRRRSCGPGAEEAQGGLGESCKIARQRGIVCKTKNEEMKEDVGA
ncbi:hypothetical protein B0H14DRAFT_2876583 [Mycena olivaceomarginata]|nr:hypothetical protein B0H14DRAFT_2876583 [Mycena olivaceomarginata]